MLEYPLSRESCSVFLTAIISLKVLQQKNSIHEFWLVYTHELLLVDGFNDMLGQGQVELVYRLRKPNPVPGQMIRSLFALFAVAEGWLLLDIGLFVLFLEICYRTFDLTITLKMSLNGQNMLLLQYSVIQCMEIP